MLSKYAKVANLIACQEKRALEIAIIQSEEMISICISCFQYDFTVW